MISSALQPGISPITREDAGGFGIVEPRSIWPSPSITINGITQLADLSYAAGVHGRQSVTQWDARTNRGLDLPIFGAGAAPTIGQFYTMLSGKAYQSTNTSLGNIGTKDFVFEFIANVTDTNVRIATKWDPSVAAPGWRFFHLNPSGYAFYFQLTDATLTGVSVLSGGLTAGTKYHIMLFGDRSGSGQFYVNGVASGSAANISGASTSVDTTNKFTIGARENGASIYDENINWVSLWTLDNWLDTHLQVNVALQRYRQIEWDAFDG